MALTNEVSIVGVFKRRVFLCCHTALFAYVFFLIPLTNGLLYRKMDRERYLLYSVVLPITNNILGKQGRRESLKHTVKVLNGLL